MSKAKMKSLSVVLLSFLFLNNSCRSTQDRSSLSGVLDISSQTSNADGTINVVCSDGSVEVVTQEQLLVDDVCRQSGCTLKAVNNTRSTGRYFFKSEQGTSESPCQGILAQEICSSSGNWLPLPSPEGYPYKVCCEAGSRLIGGVCIADPKPCGNIPNGQVYEVSVIDHGRIMATCDNGQPVNPKVLCDTTAFLFGDSCLWRCRPDLLYNQKRILSSQEVRDEGCTQMKLRINQEIEMCKGGPNGLEITQYKVNRCRSRSD